MDRCQLTCYGLASVSALDSTFIYRIFKVERNPGRLTVFIIAAALLNYSPVVTEGDAQQLIKLSGYVPPHAGTLEKIIRKRFRD